MSKSVYLMIFVLAIALAYASSQTSSSADSSQNTQKDAQTPSGANTGSQAQGASAPAAAQTHPAGKAPGSATDASGGGVAGAAGSAAAQTTESSEEPQTPAAAAAMPDSDLQAQIQNALTKEPTLSGDTVNVNVASDAIEITGSVATAREKQTATRIVQSYAGNKKVVSHLTITGRNRNAAQTTATPK